MNNRIYMLDEPFQHGDTLCNPQASDGCDGYWWACAALADIFCEVYLRAGEDSEDSAEVTTVMALAVRFIEEFVRQPESLEAKRLFASLAEQFGPLYSLSYVIGATLDSVVEYRIYF